jgi:macrolide-specific efflux system membrane fusion protein
VQVVDGSGAVATRRIRIGVSDRVNAQVVDGLEPGDRIALKSVAARGDDGRPSFGPRL